MNPKEMQQVEVYVNEKNLIVISQDYFGKKEPDCVSIHPDQVELLIKWLNEAKGEIEQISKSSGESQ
jgi:hypothetical protein